MVRLRQLEKDDGIYIPFRHYQFATPAVDVDLCVAALDLNAAVVGDYAPIINGGVLPHPMSLFITKTDAAGGDLVLGVRFKGWDQFGQPIDETVTVAAGTGTAHTTKVYARLLSAQIVTLTAKGAGDSLNVGITAASASVKYGLPLKLRKVSATGVGGVRDTVKAVFEAGALEAGVSVDASTSSFTGSAVAANANVTVTMDPAALPE